MGAWTMVIDMKVVPFLSVRDTFSNFLAETYKLIILYLQGLSFDKAVSAHTFSTSEHSEN